MAGSEREGEGAGFGRSGAGWASGEKEPSSQTSSRASLGGAGWECSPGDYQQRLGKRRRPFSWLSPVPLWQSRNDRLARWFGDPTNDRRRAWLRQLPQSSDFVLRQAATDAVSFLVMGDTGEGDASQFAVVEPLLSRSADTAFLFLCSDVIYPAGGIEEYEDKFFAPYGDYPAPIYAVPGNHDWYDDASGFMFWFCGAQQPPPRRRARPLSKDWVRDRLWRRAPQPRMAAVERMRMMRAAASHRSRQPGPYFALDAGPLRLVGIDTGITGVLDHEQGEWLRRVSRDSARPKILLTGKPLYVDASYRPGNIEGGGTVDEVVRVPEHNYIAAIGGDIHNYQRYPVALGDGRTIMHLVSGGGGAFMHETHTLPNLDDVAGLPVGEQAFRCYPLRGDSLSRYSQLYARKVPLLGRGLHIDPDEAAALVGERLGIEPTRPSARRTAISARARRAAKVLFRLPARRRRGLHIPFSEWLDWNQPPMFKSFLRLDASAEEVRIRCFAATGCLDQERDPPVEDDLRARRLADGTWEWTWPQDRPASG